MVLLWLILWPVRGDSTDEVAATVGKEGATVIAHLIDAKGVQVVVTVAPYHARFEGVTYQEGSFWGSLEKPPQTVIKNLAVKINTAAITVLPSVFDYLGNPTKITISSKGDSFVVKIFGGDAGASYIAALTFTGQYLVKKRVDSAEFKGEIYEETNYVNKALNSNL